MKQAFLLIAHKNVEQIKQLIEFIADDKHHVYVHIDQKNDDIFNQLKQSFKSFNSVFFLESRISINWGGISQVQVSLELLKKSIIGNYDFYHLISGQDLFIKSKKEVISYLQMNKGKQFLEVKKNQDYWRIKGYYLFSDSKYGRMRLITIINHLLSKLYKKVPFRSNLKEYELYKGSNWFTLSGDCVRYILNYLEDNPKYIKEYKHTICADEHFFQTLVLNSPFKKSVVNDTLREIQWEGGPNPRIYTINDYVFLCNSPSLFARKFDLDVDDEIVKRLYQQIKKN